MHPASIVKPAQVVDVESLEQFICQQIGCGFVTFKDRAILRKKVKEFFVNYPKATWQTLTATVEWSKTRRKRLSRVYQVVDYVRYALEDGYLPELDPDSQEDVDVRVRQILATEHDAQWRHRLMVAQGLSGKSRVIEAWELAHAG